MHTQSTDSYKQHADLIQKVLSERFSGHFLLMPFRPRSFVLRWAEGPSLAEVETHLHKHLTLISSEQAESSDWPEDREGTPPALWIYFERVNADGVVEHLYGLLADMADSREYGLLAMAVARYQQVLLIEKCVEWRQSKVDIAFETVQILLNEGASPIRDIWPQELSGLVESDENLKAMFEAVELKLDCPSAVNRQNRSSRRI